MHVSLKTASFLTVSMLLSGAAFAFPADRLFGLSVTAGARHTDNRDQIDDGYVVNGVPEKKVEQWKYYIGPTLSLHREIVDRLLLDVSYAPVYNEMDEVRKGSEKSQWTHTVKAALTYQFNPRTKVQFSDNYFWNDQKTYYWGDDYDYDPNRSSRVSDSYSQNSARLGVTRFLSAKTWAKVSGRVRTKRYDEQELADYSDEDEFGLRLDVMCNSSRFFSWGAFADYTDWDRENRGTRYAGESMKVGVSYAVIGLQASFDLGGDNNNIVYASTGYNKVWYDDCDLDDQDLLGDSRVELRLFQLHETQLLAGLRYGIDYSDTYPFSSQEDLATYVSLIRYFGEDRRYRLNGAVEWRVRTYNLYDDMDPASERYGYWAALKERNEGRTSYDRDSLYLRGAFFWRVNDYLSLNAFCSFEKIDTDIGTDFEETVYGATATVKLY